MAQGKVIRIDVDQNDNVAALWRYTADNYTDLIVNVAPVANEGELAFVYGAQGIWLINRKLKGVYVFQSGVWEYANQELQDKLQLFELIDFDPQSTPPTFREGRLWYDDVNKTLSYFNDETDSSLQIGQEEWFRAKNETGVTIPNGFAVYVNGESGGLPTVALAQANLQSTALSTIGVATHDVEDGTFGYFTVSGTIRDVDTSLFTAGDIIFLSATVPGFYTNIPPQSPNYQIILGVVTKSDAIEGTGQVGIQTGTNTGGVLKIFNGAILEDTTLDVISDGVTVSLTLEKLGGGDIDLFFDSNFQLFDATPIASVNLTAGTDVAPILNYVYIPQSTNVLTTNTTGFPDVQIAPIAKVLVQSPASLQSDGCYMCFGWDDHLSSSVSKQGHLSHINRWVREQNATWLKGVLPSVDITVNAGTSDNVDFATTIGDILQLHQNSFPATDTGTGSEIYVVNDFTTPFEKITDLNEIDALDDGTAISNNNRYNLVIWGVSSEDFTETKVYLNLPDGTYINDADAINDINNTSNFNIPLDFKGAGFLIARVTLKFQTASSGTYTLVNLQDLRGLFPATSAASGGLSGSLQTTYNNSIPDPEILTDTTRGALTIRRGSALDSDDVFEIQNGAGVQRFSIDGDGRIITIGKSEVNTALVDAITHSLSIIPTGTLGLEEVWHGIHIDGVNTDPTDTGAEISGIEIDLSGVDVTNDPVIHGLEIDVPLRKDAIHIHEGQVVVNNLPDNTVANEFHAHDVRVDLINLVSSSAWSAMAVTAVGSTTGNVDALLVRNLIGVVRQEVGTFVTPSQTDFAGRKTGGGTTWVDGVDGIAIFAVNDDEVYIGSSAQFSQIEVIMGTVATKDVQPTFFYNTAPDTWTQFFPDDETSGFQTSSLISWVPDSISALWTGDGDPGAGDTTAGFWIKIIRTRNGSVGTPTPTTMKTGTVVTYSWNKEGVLNVKTLNETTPTWKPLNVNLADGSTIGVSVFINDDNAGKFYEFDGASDDLISFDWDLKNDGVDYDGSDLAIELFGRISSNGSGGDTVGWLVDYKFGKAGDNLATGATNIAQQNVDVSSELQDIGFSTVLGTMTGVSDATHLYVTLTRNATGAGADAYVDDWEGMGIKINKV